LRVTGYFEILARVAFDLPLIRSHINLCLLHGPATAPREHAFRLIRQFAFWPRLNAPPSWSSHLAGSQSPLSQTRQHFSARPQEFPVFRPFRFGPLRVVPVLRHGPPDTLDAFRRLRPRAQPPVEPATSVRHCRTPATAPASGPRTASRRPGEIPRRVPVLQPAAPRLMGCFNGFRCHPPPPVHPTLPRPQWPARPGSR
jgi:hypothetical protein